MKTPAFQFYPGDFLSSPDVQMMTAQEVGAYCLLLFNSWIITERPGYLPNNEKKLQRLSRLTPEEWEESKEVLLEKFPVSEDGLFRANKRILAEFDKQEQHRAKQSENGKRGGRPPKANENPTKSQNKAVGFSGLTQTKAKKSSSFSSSSSNNINGGENDFIEQALSQIQNDPLTPKPNTQKDDATREAFNLARRRFPGTKQGEETEWLNFKKKHSDDPKFKDLPDTILKAIEAQERARNALRLANRFVPEWPHFQTWINQRRWEQETEAPTSQHPTLEPPKRIVNSAALFGELR